MTVISYCNNQVRDDQENTRKRLSTLCRIEELDVPLFGLSLCCEVSVNE